MSFDLNTQDGDARGKDQPEKRGAGNSEHAHRASPGVGIRFALKGNKRENGEKKLSTR